MNHNNQQPTNFKVEFYTDASGKERRHRARFYSTAEGMLRAGVRWEAKGLNYYCRYWNGLNTWQSAHKAKGSTVAAGPVLLRELRKGTRGKKGKTEILSIFGLCEAAAATVMIDKGQLTKIPPEQIPESAAYSVMDGVRVPARFAVVVPGEHRAEFEQLCREMRA